MCVSSRSVFCSPNCKRIRKVKGRITLNKLPVPVPLFLQIFKIISIVLYSSMVNGSSGNFGPVGFSAPPTVLRTL